MENQDKIPQKIFQIIRKVAIIWGIWKFGEYRYGLVNNARPPIIIILDYIVVEFCLTRKTVEEFVLCVKKGEDKSRSTKNFINNHLEGIYRDRGGISMGRYAITI